MATKLLTTREVAERLRLHPRTVESYLRKGRIRALKAGRNWRVPEAELESFIQNQMAAIEGSRGESKEWEALTRAKLAEIWNHPDEVEYQL